MVDSQDLTNIDEKGIAFTIRSVFVIDPSKKIRLTMMYPASTGRNTNEVLRVVDSLQMGDKKGVTTPIDWMYVILVTRTSQSNRLTNFYSDQETML